MTLFNANKKHYQFFFITLLFSSVAAGSLASIATTVVGLLSIAAGSKLQEDTLRFEVCNIKPGAIETTQIAAVTSFGVKDLSLCNFFHAHNMGHKHRVEGFSKTISKKGQSGATFITACSTDGKESATVIDLVAEGLSTPDPKNQARQYPADEAEFVTDFSGDSTKLHEMLAIARETHKMCSAPEEVEVEANGRHRPGSSTH